MGHLSPSSIMIVFMVTYAISMIAYCIGNGGTPPTMKRAVQILGLVTGIWVIGMFLGMMIKHLLL